jgi:hypothetical protein
MKQRVNGSAARASSLKKRYLPTISDISHALDDYRIVSPHLICRRARSHAETRHLANWPGAWRDEQQLFVLRLTHYEIAL